MQRRMVVGVVLGLLAILATANRGQEQAPDKVAPDKVTLQLKWVTQAQFAGYYAAKQKGLYGAEQLDVTIRPGGLQPFDMNLLLQKQVDAAAAMTYNEYKQVLDAGVKPEDLVVIDFNKEGTAMLEDGVFVTADYLK